MYVIHYSDVLAQANPNFANQIQQLYNEAKNPGPYHASGSLPLPADKPGDNGLIGLLSTSIRKLVKVGVVPRKFSTY